MHGHTEKLIDDLLGNVEVMSEQEWDRALDQYREVLLRSAEFRVLRNNLDIDALDGETTKVKSLDVARERVEAQYGVGSQQTQVIMSSIIGIVYRDSLPTYQVEQLTEALQDQLPAFEAV